MKSKFFPAAFLALALLSACGSVPLMSYVQMFRIDVATTNLSVLRVAVQLPEAIKPRPGGVAMQLTIKSADDPERKTALILVPTAETTDLQELQDAGPAESRTYIYRLSAADVDRLNALRADILKNKASGKGGSLGLGIETKEFCRIKAVPKGPILATTFLLTSETARYVIVTDRVNLRDTPQTAEELEHLEPC